MKLLYPAKRNPACTVETFPARWRQHGHLAMSQPLWDINHFYMQADLIRPPLPGTSDAYEGVAYVFLGSDILVDPSPEQERMTALLLEDELIAFDGPVMPLALMVDEETIKAGPRGGFTAFFFHHDVAAARATAAAFDAGKARRVIVNLVDQGMPASEAPLLDYKAVVEVSADSLDGLTALLDRTGPAAWQAADLALATRENILWDPQSLAGG